MLTSNAAVHIFLVRLVRWAACGSNIELRGAGLVAEKKGEHAGCELATGGDPIRDRRADQLKICPRIGAETTTGIWQAAAALV